MLERTFVLIKPECVYRAMAGRVISRLEDAGLRIVALRMLAPDRRLAGLHYGYDRRWLINVGEKSIAAYRARGVPVVETAMQIGARVRKGLINALANKPVMAIVVEGNEAISAVRKMIGGTEPKCADPSSIRGSLSTDSYDAADAAKRPIRNLVHASEDRRSAEREIALWFGRSETLRYARADQQYI